MSSKHILSLLNSGQTGVERGAYCAAQRLGIAVSGYMRADGRDELGPVPEEIARALVPCAQNGPRRARQANVESATVVVVAVPQVRSAAKFTGMKHVIHCARERYLPLFMCDPETDLPALAAEVIAAPRICDSTRIYVTGPRGTRWSDGESMGHNLVRVIALASPSLSELALTIR